MKHKFKMAVASAALALSGCAEHTYPDQNVTDVYAKMFLRQTGDNAEEVLVGKYTPMEAPDGTQLGTLFGHSVYDNQNKQGKCMKYSVFTQKTVFENLAPYSSGSASLDACID